MPHEPPLLPEDRDRYYMGLALAQARAAAALGEVPVGAVLVRPDAAGDEVLASAHNHPIGLHDPTAHAEVLALRQSAQVLQNYRLDGCELYVTLEPCAMCAQALLHARVARLVYGAGEPKTGAAGSVVNLFAEPTLNHQTKVQGGVRADEASALLQVFFAERRAAAKTQATPLRQDALRPPPAVVDGFWNAVPALAERSVYCSNVPGLDGLRLHVLCWPGHSTGMGLLALHSPNAWCVQWAGWAAEQARAGHAVCVPDLIGFGLSDKPKKAGWHNLARHADLLLALLAERVPGRPWQIFTTPDQTALAQHLLDRAPHWPHAIQVLQPPPPDDLPADWRDLPYPDAGHRVAQRAWPKLTG